MCSIQWLDAFGLPAEQYAIKTASTRRARPKQHRHLQAPDQIARFRYDWSAEVDTTDRIFQWTQ